MPSELRAAIVYDCLYPYSRGGGERVYHAIAETLVAQGFEVDYLTRSVLPDEMQMEHPFTVLPVWSGEIYDKDGTRTPSGAILFGWGVFRALRARRKDYSVVVASTLPALTVLAARLALLGGSTKLVADWLEVWPARKWREYSGLIVGTMGWVLQGLAARVTLRHTVNSDFTARRFREIRRRAQPVVLGLVDLVEPEFPPLSPADPPYLLAVGRFIPDKRLDAIPAALAVARRRYPDLRAIIVGTGPEETAVRAAAERAEMSDHIVFAGVVDDRRLAELRARASVFVHPSRREGFGLVVAEAAAAGVPSVVITGDDNAAVDLIEHMVNGVLAASVEPEDLGGALTEVLDAGQTLRRSSLEWFDEERAAHGLAASLKRVIYEAVGRD